MRSYVQNTSLLHIVDDPMQGPSEDPMTLEELVRGGSFWALRATYTGTSDINNIVYIGTSDLYIIDYTKWTVEFFSRMI